MTHEPVPPWNLTPVAAASRWAAAVLSARRNLSRKAAQCARLSAPCRGVALRYSWYPPPGPSLAAVTGAGAAGVGGMEGGGEANAGSVVCGAWGRAVCAAPEASGAGGEPVRPGVH